MKLRSRLKMVVRRSLTQVELSVIRGLTTRPKADCVSPSYVMLMIYRSRNSVWVEKIVAQARSSEIKVFLWALDDVIPSLKEQTVGSGAGLRNELLTRLQAASDLKPSDYVIICDDDVEFPNGDIAAFLQIAVDSGFMLSQPGHLLDSYFNFAFTCARPHLVARATEFVEVGPFVLVHPAFRDRVFPMRQDLGMGWGSTVDWHKGLGAGERFGIVDAIGIRHRSPTGVDYDTDFESARLSEKLQAAGIADVNDLCITTGRWYRGTKSPWRIAPPEARALLPVPTAVTAA